MHSLLKRQIKRCLGDQFSIPQEWQEFIDVVNDAYQESDMARGMLERSLEQSSQELLQANSELQAIFQAMPDLLFRLDCEGTILTYETGDTSHFFYQPEELIGKRIQDVPLRDVGTKFREAIRRVQETRALSRIEYLVTVQGRKLFYEARLLPLPEDQIMVIVRNITELKQVEEQRQASIHFLESLDQVNRAMQRVAGVEQMLWDAVKVVYSIFDCDRAWLLYPCDPEAPTFRVPVEFTRPGYPGAYTLDLDVPMKPGADRVCAAALASEDPIAYGPDTDYPIYKELVDQFGVLSQMVMAVHTKVGKPWMFGMHQCSHARLWTQDEQRLFKEIGRRLGDALSTLLLLDDLRESEERFELAAQGSGDGLWDWPDLTKEAQWWSPRRYEMLGYEPGEIEPSIRSWLAMIHPDDLDEALAAMQVHFQTRVPYDMEYRLRHKSGEYRWMRSRGQSIWGEDGQVRRMSGSLQDVTERKRAEEQLRRLKEFNENIVQNMAEGIVLQDSKGTMIFVNPATAALLGYKLEEIEGRHWTAITPPDQHSVIDAANARRLRGESDRYELELVGKDGRRISVLVSGSPRFEEGRFVGTLAVFADITERKRTEDALRKSEEKWRLLYENLPGGSFVVNRDYVIEDVNDILCVLTGFTREELVGQLCGIICPKGPHKCPIIDLGKKRIDNDETSVRTKDGGFVPIIKSAIRIPVVGQEVIVENFQDITERKQAEAELARHRDRLEELVRERTAELMVAKDAAEEAQRRAEAADRAKSAFLASMSHELRTPLNAVLGYAQILQRRPLEPEVVNSLSTIQQSGEHLLILIDDILTISEIETGRMELYPTPIRFSSFLDHIAGIVRARAEAKGLAFSFEELDPLPAGVQADETRLRQVLLNLLDNAVKFTDKGQVTLRVKQMGKWANGRMGEFADLQILRFEVEDTGIGIPPTHLERIFQPFEQAEDVSRWTKGAGLGLAISRQLLHLMGGELQVESEPGRGSTFWFEVALPVARAAETVAQHPDRAASGYRGPQHSELVPPPEEELAILLDLARRGDMRGIGEQAVHIETLGEQYVPFANRLYELTRDFEERQILALVGQYMDEETES